jgi:hypothetical protein
MGIEMDDVNGSTPIKNGNGNGVKITAEAIIAIVDDCDGNLTEVARTLHCDRGTIYNRMNEQPTVKKAFEQAREKMIDTVESVLYREAKSGEAWAVCFFLKTQAKHRGYTERQEVTGPSGESLVVEIVRRKEEN